MTKRWRLAILIPLVYLILASVIHELFFVRVRGGEGFMPFDRDRLPAAVAVCAAYAFTLWILLERAVRQNRRTREALSARGLLNEQILFLQQMRELVYADLVCLPGLVAFILTADMTLLLFLCVVSMLLYLRIMPRTGTGGGAAA